MKLTFPLILLTVQLFAQSSPQLAVVSAADYSYAVAPGSIVTIFAPNIASSTMQAPSGPLPTILGNVSATITDASGATFPISLMLVAPSQINAVLPPTLESGTATISLKTATGVTLKGTANLSQVAPAIFTADQSGQWLAAAQVVIAHPDGTQTLISSVATCGATLLSTNIPSYFSTCSPVPINLGSSVDQAVLVLFGTGIRNAIQLIATKCPKCGYDPVDVSVGQICNTCANGPAYLPILYAGPQGASAATSNGLDQINVSLPNWLSGSGLVSVNIDVAGGGDNPAEGANVNSVSIYIR